APVRIQYDALRTYFTGKRVLVTGAAGSIGAEVVRQLTRFRPALVIAADINESALFELEQELLQARPEAPVQVMLADIRDARKIDWAMATGRPEVVVHAAAYKHVPMMEREVEEAVKTNVFGTLTVAEAALRHDVETFVFISSDKAVHPGNVLGATKRVGELIVQAFGARQRTRFLAVRFGNVLGSRGSLIPLMLEQIRNGGPVTITHPDMTRYFMTISEAVLLVLQTPLMTAPGSVFMLEMGSPIRIVDLVRDLIRLAGLEDDRDIPIVFSGIRAGEKLQEQLVGTDEEFVPTAFDGIGEVRSSRTVDEVTLRLALRELQARVEAMDADGVRSLLRRICEATSVPATLEWAGAGAGLAQGSWTGGQDVSALGGTPS
ncbi:MAG: SDR family NAD(P)-dependent oxidoreductase, partial [Armatimonadota bacterium]|nr:SDR family NAD(P)-dependent oxidoreductase [Armatimonadota bacterium]